MTTQNNKSIRIFDKIYLGLSATPGNMAVGYLVPYEENAAGKRRMEQVDYWGRNKNRVILDNTPIAGFRVSRSLRNMGWRTEISTVTMEDPRGFETEITAMNLVMLTDNAIIQDGEILQECVWARDGAVNVLLPVNSAPYIEAKENTRRLNSKVPTREIQIGDTIRTDKAVEGVYMGYLYPLSSKGYRSKNLVTIEKKKMHVLKIRNEDGGTEYMGIAAFKVADVLQRTDTPSTLDASEIEMGQPDTKFVQTRNRYYYPQIVGFVVKNDAKIELEFQKVSYQDLLDRLNGPGGDGFNIVYHSDAPKPCTIGKNAKPNKWYFMDMYELQGAINNGSRRHLPGYGYSNIQVFTMHELDYDAVQNSATVSMRPGGDTVFVDFKDSDNFYLVWAKVVSNADAINQGSILL